MKVPQEVKTPLSREQLIVVLRRGGLKIPDGAQFDIDNGAQYDERRAATIGPDGPLVVSWTVEIDVGNIGDEPES